jgi:hypothetical protein
MKGLVMAAGWPCAGLLALDAGRAGASGTASVRGFVAESDDQGHVCILESGEVIGPLAIDATTDAGGWHPVSRGTSISGHSRRGTGGDRAL